MERNINRAAASTMKVMTNSSRPSSTSEETVKLACRLGEFIGDRSRDRGTRRKQRRIDTMRVADHKGDGHGLAQGAAQRQHRPAHHTGASERQRHFRITSHWVPPTP